LLVNTAFRRNLCQARALAKGGFWIVASSFTVVDLLPPGSTYHACTH